MRLLSCSSVASRPRRVAAKPTSVSGAGGTGTTSNLGNLAVAIFFAIQDSATLILPFNPAKSSETSLLTALNTS